MLHVDDILFVSDDKGCKDVERALESFLHSGFEYLTVDSPIVFCGVEIRRQADLTVDLSQRDFYDKICVPSVAELVQNDVFLQSADIIRRHLKSFIGACIWLYQTRFDIIYEVSRLASLIPDALAKPCELVVFLKAADKLFLRITQDHVPLKFFPWKMNGPRPPQLFVFDDASFASLRNSGSTEAMCIVYGFPQKRNGPVQCFGNILYFSARRIARICRSSAHAESIAIANAADMCLYLQCALSEILFDVNDFRFLHEAVLAPLITPFKATPSVDSVRAGMSSKSSKVMCADLNKPMCYFNNDMSDSKCAFFCPSCSVRSCFSVSCLQDMYVFPSSLASGPLIHALLMSDCSNVISSLMQGNSRADEKCLRIVHAYLKDFLQYMNISFCSALFNMSDVGTKNCSNLQIWRRFLRSGIFFVGCMSRKECKTIATQVRPGGFRPSFSEDVNDRPKGNI